MAVDVIGLATVSVFYCFILIIGLWAAWRQGRDRGPSESETLLLAKRDLGTLLGTLSLTATWVGGGHVISSTEGAFSNGLVWCQAPLGYGLALIVAGLFFAKPMRSACYQTLLDPFQEAYGPVMGALLFLPAVFGELCWSSAILSALGAILSRALSLDINLAVVMSSTIAALYTLTGGLFSVANTHVAQLLAIGLDVKATCVPFVWMNEAVDGDSLTSGAWAGVVEYHNVGVYIENYLIIILGGIPWQVYFQRVLAARNAKQAQSASLFAGLATFLFAGPPICLGLLARVTDWNKATDGGVATEDVQGSAILPLVLQYLTPKWVSYIGLSAIAAAVMSSIDSAILSSSSMFAVNIYRSVFFPWASDAHVVRVLRLTIVVMTGLSSLMALKVNSIYGLYVLGLDFAYVIMFPQLLLVLYWNEHSNSYGCLSGLMAGLALRLLGGEPVLGLAPTVQFPFYDEKLGQLFPFKTASMIAGLLTHVITSYAFAFLFRKVLPPSCDLLGSFKSASANAHYHLDSVNSLSSTDFTRASTDLPSKESVKIPRAIFRKGSNRYQRNRTDLQSSHI